ncbi:MAG: hypothetical protein ACRD0Q_04175 [Acidimicrobiales bacterium]
MRSLLLALLMGFALCQVAQVITTVSSTGRSPTARSGWRHR